MTAGEKFIELDRRFRDLTDEEREDPGMLAVWGFHESQLGTAWDELLKSERVVILAEAGSGKTKEMLAQERQLTSEGKPAFFIPVEALDREGVRGYLSTNSAVEQRFDSWSADGDQTAWFFIDAVDELKLTDGKLSSALGKLAREIGDHQARARILISCRPTDWRPVQDMETFQSLLPVSPPVTEQVPVGEEGFLAPFRAREEERQKPAGPEPTKARCVVLLPLGRQQIETFARASGVSDTKAFREEIHRRDAWTFARRPLDLQGLINTWRETGKLGSRREQHETDVTLSLRDNPDRADQGLLTTEQAVEGVERLALAMLRTRARTIRAPEQAVSPSTDQSSLNAEEILSDWTPRQVKTLLRRAIFDPATYGRVRFHHRSVQEYLAARRLTHLRERGLPTRQLWNLLFADTYGESVLIPSMRPVAAWLANSDAAIAAEVLRREPEALILHGDPETLPLPTRVGLVRSYVAAYCGGDWRGLDMPIAELQRLARPDLKEIIRECWGQAYENEEVREFLLKLIWLGAIEACADLANEALWDVSLGEHARVLASRALEECKRFDLLAVATKDLTASSARWPNRLIHGFAAEVFPQAISAKALGTIIERTPEPKRTVGGFSWALLNQADELDPHAATTTALRRVLQDLVWKGKEGSDWWEPRSRFSHLSPALTRLCHRQLAAGIADKSILRAAVIANRFHDKMSLGSDDLEILRSWFAANDRTREAVFWLEVEAMHEIAPTEDIRLWVYHSQHHSLTSNIRVEDWPWLLKGLAKARAVELRGVALEALISLWHERGRAEPDMRELQRRIADAPNLLTHLAERTKPAPHDGRPAQWELDQRKRAKKHAAEKAQVEKSWRDWLPKLKADPERAFRGKAKGTSRWNLWRWLGFEKHRQGDGNHLARRNWRRIREVVNDRVGELFEASMREHWRKTQPPLKSRRDPAERNFIYDKQCMALTGLLIEAAADDAWATKLTRSHARRAAEWATLELNGFPDWFPDLAKAHPKIVTAVLKNEIDSELAGLGVGDHSHVIGGLRYGSGEARKLVAPHLVEVLSVWPRPSRSPQKHAGHLSVLESVLSALVLAGTHREELANIAERRFSANPGLATSGMWLKALASSDLRRAVQAMRKGLPRVAPANRTERGVEWFGILFGDRGRHGDSVSLEADADLLLELTKLAYHCIRREDDVEHEGVFSPGPRDEAETARNRLLGAIIGQPGIKAYGALLALADEPMFAHMKDRLRLMARQRASSDSEPAALSPKEVRTWEDRYETPPKNRDELFQVMLDRLDDIRHDILHHDFNDRADLEKISREEEMQPKLARKLEDAARGQFHVTREEEVAGRKETDIRLLAPSSDKAVVEIKIGDRCSLNELLTAVDDQLIKKYLRHNRCTAGCLLVTYAGRTGFRCPETGKEISFGEVIRRVRGHAKQREAEEKGRIRVDVVGLDLRDPLRIDPSPA